MKTKLIVVGKTTNKHIEACIEEYVDRIQHYMPFSIEIIPEIRNTRSLTEIQQKESEGQLILKRINPTDTVVLLDEHGKESRSLAFASWLENKQILSKQLVFIIGGPYGFSQAVYQRANEKLSLSLPTAERVPCSLIFPRT